MAREIDGVPDSKEVEFEGGVAGICQCDDPTVVRTMAKGTPAEREFCECGGMVR